MGRRYLVSIDIRALKEKAGRPLKSSRAVARARKKLEVLERDGFKCVVCGDEKDLTIDHVERPKPKKTSDSTWYRPEVCRTLCVPCHERKNRSGFA